MRIVIRTDASVGIGTGHVMRCLTLAECLHERHADIAFICRELPGNLCEVIEERGFAVHRLPSGSQEVTPQPGDDIYTQWLGVSLKAEIRQVRQYLARQPVRADWLIVDHYALDAKWERQMRPEVESLMVIDDLANRPHDCDILLDQNFHADHEPLYSGLVPPGCEMLLGPAYALLRPEFSQVRGARSIPSGQIQRVLVNFGGSDAKNETLKAIKALQKLRAARLTGDIVVGRSNPHRDQIEQLCDRNGNLRFHYDVRNMAHLMSGADLAIGAAGSTMWERCCVGLPSIMVSIAENQVAVGREAHDAGFSYFAGCSDEVSVDNLVELIGQFLQHPESVARMAGLGMAMVDGMGAGRVAEMMGVREPQPTGVI